MNGSKGIAQGDGMLRVARAQLDGKTWPLRFAK
jgi:hypothetical protein